MTREEVLKRTAEIVCKDRDAQYGHPENNFALIAKMWSIWLDTEVTARDVAMMMAMLKIARIKTGKVKEDNYIDLIGYIACMTEIDMPTEPTIKITKSKAKPKFRLEDYKGNYVMHCNNEAEAETFCNHLDYLGTKWKYGEKYTKNNRWRTFGENTCYLFNEGTYGHIGDFKNGYHKGYAVLEFDDFDWS